MSGRGRRLGLLAVAVVLLAALVALAWSDLKVLVGQSPRAARLLHAPVPVKVERARLESVIEIVGANGLAEPSVVVNVPSRVTGVIERMHVEVGQLVRPGEVLVTMEKVLPQASLSAAQADLAKARGDVEIGKLQYDRMRRLYDQKVVSTVDLETAKLHLGAAEAAQGAALELLAKARQDMDLGTVIVSPITAVVQERFVNSGEAIREVREPLLKLGRVDSVLVAARVAEEKTANIAIGQSAEVLFDAYPSQPFPGTVDKIDGAVDPETRTFRAYVRVDNSALKLKPGLSAYVRIRTARPALTVPRLAVIDRAGQASVFVVEDEHARLRPVRVLPIALGRMAVLQGLKEGDLVVYFKLINIEDNDRVAIESLHEVKPPPASPVPGPARAGAGFLGPPSPSSPASAAAPTPATQLALPTTFLGPPTLGAPAASRTP